MASVMEEIAVVLESEGNGNSESEITWEQNKGQPEVGTARNNDMSGQNPKSATEVGCEGDLKLGTGEVGRRYTEQECNSGKSDSKGTSEEGDSESKEEEAGFETEEDVEEEGETKEDVEGEGVQGTSQLFKLLSIATDINVPPDNWLRGEVGERVQESCQWEISDAPEMSSIRMAALNSRKLLAADVIADSRNVKKLLQMEHASDEVSMAVHRIGKTLLLDEFPIERYIPQRHEKTHRRKRKKATSHVTTLSKFLYHTILHNQYLTPASDTDLVSRKNSFCSSDILVGMGDPLTKLSIELPQILHNKYTSRAYNRTAYWDFEDIHMLLGNNLPIFGGGEYPAISLKLRDMKEPINVLTGIDCWLDNLICNVPELAMCWHLDGLVQGYDLFKTEEIPDLTDSRFDPVVIKDLASNVLKFLKAHCVKEGHTYWLYRAKGDDIVKLYDLSSICVGVNLNEMNPFSTPVALLCFKVAQRLYEEDVEKERSTIYTLLQNCLQLVPTGVYPQMEATAHFMISDLFLSSNFEVTKENTVKLRIQPLYECQFGDLPDLFECSLSRDLLESDWVPPPSAQPFYLRNISTSLHIQKKLALSHIVSALNVVCHQVESWAVKLQKLLLFKASVIFLHESEASKGPIMVTNALLSLVTIDAYNALLYYKDTKYTHGYGYQILRCLVLCKVADLLLHEVLSSSSLNVRDSLCTFDSILISLNNYTRSFDINCTKIFEWCHFVVPDLSFSKRALSTTMETREEWMLLCLDMYLEGSTYKRQLVIKKLGFVYNELASYNLNLISLEDTIQEAVAKKLLKQSFEHYKSALAHFLECADLPNIALIYSNLGKVMRLSGQLQARFFYKGEERGALLYEEKEFYREAVNYYNEALGTLKKPSVQKDIWFAVSNELGGVYFTMASVMQEYSTASSAEECEGVIREVTNFYNKSLTISQGLVREGFTTAAGRTGSTHHRLASLYHRQSRDLQQVRGEEQGGGRKRKRLYDLAESNYRKAISYFRQSGFELEMCQSVMECVGLLQYLSPHPHSSLASCASLLGSLPPFIAANHLKTCSAPTRDPGEGEMVSSKKNNSGSHGGSCNDPAEQRMLGLLKDQVLSVLRAIVLQFKQGRVVDGFSVDGSAEGEVKNPKEIFARALREFQVLASTQSSHDMGRIVCGVLELLDTT